MGLGGGKGGNDGPDPPDPWATSRAQFDFYRRAARESALYNQMGVSSPWGQQYYTGELGSPDRQMNIELSPQQQQLLDYQQGLAANLYGYGMSELMPSAMDRLRSPDSTAVEDALYQRGLARLEPEFERQMTRTQSDLLSGGIPVGSRAYGQEMDRLQEAQNEARENLALSSQVAGAAENRAQRSQAIQELAGMLGQIPGFQSPSTMMPGATNVGAPDFMGAAQNEYLGRMGARNQQAQELGGLYGLLGMVGAGMMF